jgi:hypothetical protein
MTGVRASRCGHRARSWSRWISIAVVALSWQALTLGHARASDEEQADALFERGRKLMAEGRTAEACARFDESSQVEPATGTLLNLAVCNQKLGKTATAWAQFTTAEASARADARPDRVAFARQRLKQLAPQLSHLTLVVPQERPPGLRLSLDGSPVLAADWNVATPIDPGDHTVLADVPNAKQRAFAVRVPGPAAQLSLAIDLGSTSAVVSPAPTVGAPSAGAGAAAGDAVQTAGALPDTGGSSHIRTLAYAAGGIGAGALVTGLGFGLRAYSRWDERNRRCPMDTCSSESGKRAQRSAENAARYANIAVGGRAMGSGSGGFLVMAASPRRRARAALRSVAVLSLVSSLSGCESLVGIHDSRSLAEVDRDRSSTAAASGTPAPSGADAQTGVPASNSSTADSAEESEGRPDLSLVTPNGPATSEVNASPTGGPAPVTGNDATDAPAPLGEAPSDAGTQSPEPPSDGGPPPVEPTCTPTPPEPALAGTVFLFTAGPNGGNANGRGSCGFPNSVLARAPRYYGAVEPALMKAPASLCGACMRATFGTRSVEVTIVDVIEPNPLAHGHTLSIDGEAKQVLSDSGQNLDVQFSFVPCTAPDTIRLEFAGPGNPSVLVLGHRNPLRAVRLSTPTASVQLVRRDYNYWEAPPGFASTAGPVSLTLTDEAGRELVIANLAVSPTLVDTGLQFPVPGCPDDSP